MTLLFSGWETGATGMQLSRQVRENQSGSRYSLLERRFLLLPKGPPSDDLSSHHKSRFWMHLT